VARRPKSLDELIAEHLQQAADSGELAATKGYGKPLAEIEGWSDPPEALRMPFKILKDAGIAPPEVALFHERARLRAEIEACADGAGRDALARTLCELEQKISLRLESLRINAKL